MSRRRRSGTHVLDNGNDFVPQHPAIDFFNLKDDEVRFVLPGRSNYSRPCHKCYHKQPCDPTHLLTPFPL